MKTGVALFFLIGLGLVFELKPLWIDSGDIKPEDYQYVNLSREDSIQAINNFRRSVHYDNVGFFVNPFPASEQKLSRKTHAYFIFEHLFLIGVFLLWLMDRANSKVYVGMFLFFMLGDFVDYLIHYNEDYGRPWLTYNIIFTVLYGMFLMVMRWKQRE